MTNQTKRQYRIRNWAEYNRALVQRGSLTLWVDAHSLDAWLNAEHGRRGRPRIYTDVAILCVLLIKEVYHLPLRATQGLVSSLIRLLELDLPAPDYSTLSRRARYLNVSLSAHHANKIKHLVIDSTGLKLYGEGEWKVKMHGWARHRTWRKLHLSVDASTHHVTSALISKKDVVDPRALPRLLKAVGCPVGRVYADGAYDSRECYRAIDRLRARAIIPPRKGATLWRDEYLRDRNSNLRRVRKLGSEGWKRESKYHRRSLVETAFFRLKTLFTDKLRAREGERQRTEVLVRCAALNRMTKLGMPQSYAI